MSGDNNQVLDDIKLDMDIETIKLDDIELEEIDSEDPLELDLKNDSQQSNSELTLSDPETSDVPLREDLSDSTLDTTETLDVIEDSPEPEIPSPVDEEPDLTLSDPSESVPVLDLSPEKEDVQVDLPSEISLDSDISIPNISLEETPVEPVGTNQTEPKSPAPSSKETPSPKEQSASLFDSNDEIISIDGRELDRIIYGEEESDFSFSAPPTLSPKTEEPVELMEDLSPTTSLEEDIPVLSDESSIDKTSAPEEVIAVSPPPPLESFDQTLKPEEIQPEEMDRSDSAVLIKKDDADIEEPVELIETDLPPVLSLNEDKESPVPLEESPLEFAEESSVKLIDQSDVTTNLPASEEIQTEKIDQVDVVEEAIVPTQENIELTEKPEELVQVSDLEDTANDDENPITALQHENFELVIESDENTSEKIPDLANEPTEVLREKENASDTDLNESFDFDLSVIPDVTEIDEDEPISLSMDELNNIDISEDNVENASQEFPTEEIEFASSAPLSQKEPDLNFVQVENADEIEIPLPEVEQSSMELGDTEEIEIEIPEEESTPETNESIEPMQIPEEKVTSKISKEPQESDQLDEGEIIIKDAGFEEITDDAEGSEAKASVEEEIPITKSDFDEISNIEMQDEDVSLTDTDLEVMIENEPQIPEPTPSVEPELTENEEHVEIALEELDEIQSEFNEKESVASTVYQTEPGTESAPTTDKSNRELIEEKMEGLSEESKEELKSVLKYLDNLLEDLPDSKIKEFSESKYYDLYVKILDKLGV